MSESEDRSSLDWWFGSVWEQWLHLLPYVSAFHHCGSPAKLVQASSGVRKKVESIFTTVEILRSLFTPVWVSREKLLLEEAAGRPTVYTSFHVMHWPLLQAELKRITSLITYSKPWMRYHQTKLTWYWEILMPVLVQGTLWKITGKRAEVLMDLVKWMMQGRNFWASYLWMKRQSATCGFRRKMPISAPGNTLNQKGGTVLHWKKCWLSCTRTDVV